MSTRCWRGRLVVDYHGARRGALTPVQIARAVELSADGHRFDVKLDGELLARIVRPRLGQWIVRAHNAQFAVAGSSVHVVPSRPGNDVDPGAARGRDRAGSTR